jgi:flagellar M-ring protein FliF
MSLAAEGLPKAAPGAYEMLGEMPLGTSRAVEGMRLRQAQEREMAAAIESLDGVERARVLIAWPEPSPFVRDRPPVSASVTVTLATGRTLSELQSRAILHLVAGAVPGLSTDHVAIADQTGRLLAGEPGARDGQGDRRVALQARIEARAREAILMLLGPIVGPENLTAQVSVDIDFAAREAASERFDPEGSVRSESESRSTSSEPRAIGIPGALTNTVPAAPTVAAEAPLQATGPTVNTTGSESRTRNYEVGRSVEVLSNNGGTIRRMTAAVVIHDGALGPAQTRAARLREIERLVAGAIGTDERRGDRVEVVARPFAPPVANVIPLWQEPVIVESSKWLAIALVALGLLAFVIRPLLRRWEREAEAERAAGELALPPPLPDPRLIDYAGKLAEARLIASTDATRATAVARWLLAEPAPEPAIPAPAAGPAVARS